MKGLQLYAVVSALMLLALDSCGGKPAQKPATPDSQSIHLAKPLTLQDLLGDDDSKFKYEQFADYGKLFSKNGTAKSLDEVGPDFTIEQRAFYYKYVGVYELAEQLSDSYISSHVFQLSFDYFSWGSGLHLGRIPGQQELAYFHTEGKRYSFHGGGFSEPTDDATGSFDPGQSYVLGASASNPNSIFLDVLAEKSREYARRADQLKRSSSDLEGSRVVFRDIVRTLSQGDYEHFAANVSPSKGALVGFFKTYKEVTEKASSPDDIRSNKLLPMISNELKSVRTDEVYAFENAFYSETTDLLDAYPNSPVLFELKFRENGGYLAVLLEKDSARYYCVFLRSNIWEPE